MRILLVEDDAMIGESVQEGLHGENYAVDWVRDGRGAELALDNQVYDLVLLDLGLPKKQGLDVLADYRKRGGDTPVLILTARDATPDRVKGLDAGADDYLVKPFAGSELLARVTALGRRPPIAEAATRLSVADLEVDLLKRTVTRAGTRIDLQQQEYKLLEYLMRHAGEIVTRTMLLENVWSFHFDPGTNLIESHMSRLRAKVDRGFDRELIHTVRNAGYRLDAEV
jgi:two-component system OmpR family response regulator